MIDLYEFLSSRMSFAASRKAKYEKTQKQFDDFKKFLEDLEGIPGLFVTFEFDKTFETAKWLRDIKSENDIHMGEKSNVEETKKNVFEFSKIYKDSLCIYLTKSNSLYEIRRNEAVKGKYKAILNDVFNGHDIYKKSQLTDDKYLIIGKFEINDPILKPLKKWGFEEAFICNDKSLPFKFDYSQGSSHWYFERNSDYLAKPGKPSDNLDDDENPIIYLIISFKKLYENIKYINKEFFDITEDGLQESKISKLIMTNENTL